MKTFFFVPKLNASDDSTRDIYKDYQEIFSKANLTNVDLVSFDKKQPFLSYINILEESLFLIPSILDTFNAFSYDGIEFALKIYFYYASQKNNKFRIVILGIEEESEFWRHCRYSNILKCPHVDFIQYNIYSIRNYLLNTESMDWTIDWNVCVDSLKKLNISQPASYKTHHSITNEWCIYRWSKYLRIESITIKKNIEEFLYFNYLKAIYHEAKIEDPESFLLSERGKILLIDDEAGKGWHTFFKSICNGSSYGATFDSIGSTFKTMSKSEIIEQSERKIKEFDPDVVLLDLRLHNDDFDSQSPDNLTGARIFEIIKDFNNGIQIVIFSASNKVWNYLPFASDGVILKESPENSVKTNYTQECIGNMRNTLNSSLKKGCFLHVIYKSVDEIKNKLSEENEFCNSIKKQLDIAFYLVSKAETKEQYAFAYISLYQIIEIITDCFIQREMISSEDDKMYYRWKIDNGEYIKEYSWDSATKKYNFQTQEEAHTVGEKSILPQWKKMAGLIFQKWNLSDHQLVRKLFYFIEKRNAFIHNDKEILDKKDQQDQDFLNHDIFDKTGFQKLLDCIKTICLYL